jgi:hypothetical protein
MRIYVDFDEHSETGRYILACARIRDISVKSLLRRTFVAISEDQLFASVLDDADSMKARNKGEHRYSEPKAA